MSRCLTTTDFLDFLSRLTVDLTATAEGIIVHAIAGDVLWRWSDGIWCWG